MKSALILCLLPLLTIGCASSPNSTDVQDGAFWATCVLKVQDKGFSEELAKEYCGCTFDKFSTDLRKRMYDQNLSQKDSERIENIKKNCNKQVNRLK